MILTVKICLFIQMEHFSGGRPGNSQMCNAFSHPTSTAQSNPKKNHGFNDLQTSTTGEIPDMGCYERESYRSEGPSGNHQKKWRL
jgi:hypothetical protein